MLYTCNQYNIVYQLYFVSKKFIIITLKIKTEFYLSSNLEPGPGRCNSSGWGRRYVLKSPSHTQVLYPQGDRQEGQNLKGVHVIYISYVTQRKELKGDTHPCGQLAQKENKGKGKHFAYPLT